MPSTKLLAATAVVLAVSACTYERRVAAVPMVVDYRTVVTQPAIVPPPQPLLPQVDTYTSEMSRVPDEWTTPPPGDWDYYYSRRTTTQEVR